MEIIVYALSILVGSLGIELLGGVGEVHGFMISRQCSSSLVEREVGTMFHQATLRLSSSARE